MSKDSVQIIFEGCRRARVLTPFLTPGHCLSEHVFPKRLAQAVVTKVHSVYVLMLGVSMPNWRIQ
jgi:hypothetical protein